jgi:hypothetical protein
VLTGGILGSSLSSGRPRANQRREAICQPSTIVYIHEHQDNSTHPNTTTM